MSELSYGDVTGEYLALRTGAGLVTGEHELVWARGPDAVAFLNDLLSQEIAGLPVAATARSLLLAPQGKLRATLWVLRGEEEVGLVCDAGLAETVIGDLTRFLIRVDVELEPEQRPVLEVWGAGASRVLGDAGFASRPGWESRGDVVVARLPLGNLDRFGVVGDARDALIAAGARPAGSLAITAVRVEAGEPKMGVDVDERTIPQEAGLTDAAVAFDKGCFLGQELVARIDSRGRVNRHLRGIVIGESVLPPASAELVVEDKVVGTISSVAESLELRAPVALGLVRREVEPGDEVEVRWGGGSARAQVRRLPLDEFAVV